MLLALLRCIALPKTSTAQRVSVVLENVSLAEALKKVSAASGYEFFYNSNVVLKSDKRITASFDGTELKTVLDHVFSGTEFSYRIKDRTIVVVPRPPGGPPRAGAARPPRSRPPRRGRSWRSQVGSPTGRTGARWRA